MPNFDPNYIIICNTGKGSIESTKSPKKQVDLLHMVHVFLHYNTNLLEEIDAGLKVEAKVDEFPLDALLAIFFLFQDKHVMVEELLKLLIGQVDAQLLE